MTNTDVDLFSIWWANVKLEKVRDGEYFISDESFERPVVIIENRAYLVYKLTSKNREGYIVKDIDSAGLKEGSRIRTDVIVPIGPSDLIYKMGELSIDDRLGLLDYVAAHPSRMMGKKQ
ncbi:MAG: hypothetical protein IJT54_04490 [Candidatus Methanomethylophilaceae archaeon]|nr:hypothetical protein [Candidatus Methanomethylophilaceae archaeon]